MSHYRLHHHYKHSKIHSSPYSHCLILRHFHHYCWCQLQSLFWHPLSKFRLGWFNQDCSVILSFIIVLDYLSLPGTTQINKYSSVLPSGENVRMRILNSQMTLILNQPFLTLVLNANRGAFMPPTSLLVSSLVDQNNHQS